MPLRHPINSCVRRATRPVVEAIERRTLLSGGGSAVLAADGTLTVTGTSAADDIEIGGGGGDVTINGTNYHFAPDSARLVKIYGLAGNDTISDAEHDETVYVDGGPSD